MEFEFAEFSRELELQADLDSLDLMARGGFHPDFVIALYHLMATQEGTTSAEHFLVSHPAWDVRESTIRKKHSAAVREFERLWPEPDKSPGGRAPELAFLGRPRVRTGRNNSSTDISIPIQCEHITAPVEVVVLLQETRPSRATSGKQAEKLQQTTACASAPTVVSFQVGSDSRREKMAAEVYVTDTRGWVLGRSPKFPIR